MEFIVFILLDFAQTDRDTASRHFGKGLDWFIIKQASQYSTKTHFCRKRPPPPHVSGGLLFRFINFLFLGPHFNPIIHFDTYSARLHLLILTNRRCLS